MGSFALLFVVLFVLAKLQFFYLGSFFAEGSCDTLQNCFFTTLKLALTKSFSSSLNQHHPTRGQSAWIATNIIFSLSFVIIVNILFMNVIFGSIIGVFGKLREKKTQAERLKMNVCYICSLSRSDIEKLSSTNGFDQHKTSRHNILSYVRFVFYIRSKNPNHLTGAEHYVLQQLERLDSGWFPKSQNVLSDHSGDHHHATDGDHGDAGGDG